MQYDQLGLAKEAYADALEANSFALSFDIVGRPGLTVVVDRTTLERFQAQISSALLLQQPPEAHQ